MIRIEKRALYIFFILNFFACYDYGIPHSNRNQSSFIHASEDEGGIQAKIKYLKSGRLIIVEIYPEGESARAGLMKGDEIIKIGNFPVKDMGLREIVEKLRGEIGTKVNLELKRDSKIWEVQVERGPYINR